MLQDFYPASVQDEIDFINPLSDHPLNKGLVARYNVIAAGGLRLRDLKGNNHGVLTSGAALASAMGRQGGSGSISLDGTDDVVTATLSSSTVFPLTLSAWVRPTNVTGALSIVYIGASNNENGLTIVNGSYWALSEFGGNSQSTKTGAVIGEWAHVVGVFATSTSRIVYVNGVAGAEETTLRGVNSGAPVKIGNRFTSNQFGAGNVADVQIYNRALSASEVRLLYQASSQQDDPTLNRIPYATTLSFGAMGGGVTYNESGSGGISFGGGATVQAVFNTAGSGGLSLAGAATPQVTYNAIGAGGIVLAGEATVQETINVAGNGGLSLGGAAGVQCTYALAGGGGVILGGSADVQGVYNASGGGGVVLGGEAGVSGVYQVAGSGGIVIGGSASLSDEITLITEIGVEWTLPPGLMHYTLATGLLHHTLPDALMHYTLPAEDDNE